MVLPLSTGQRRKEHRGYVTREQKGCAPLNLASLVRGGKAHSGAGHTQDWWGIVTSSSSRTLAMPIQARKSSFALGTKCFPSLGTHPHPPLLHFSLKPLNPEDELLHSRSRGWSLISELFLSLSTKNSTFLYDLKTPPTASGWRWISVWAIGWGASNDKSVHENKTILSVKCALPLLKME